MPQNEEEAVKKEAVWAISNATSGGTPDQIRYICINGGVLALCRYLSSCRNSNYWGKVLTVCIEGLENMLQLGLHEQTGNQTVQNVYACLVEQFGGLGVMEQMLEHHKCPHDLEERIQSILDSYFQHRHRR